MKRTVLILAGFLIFSTTAWAHNCPALMHEIDEFLATQPDLDEETIVDEDGLKNVKQLREEGEKLHKSGNHDDSVKILQEALELLKNQV